MGEEARPPASAMRPAPPAAQATPAPATRTSAWSPLRDMYKKHHWQTAGPTFYQLHLLFDKHFNEQSELVDSLAERVQSLGGVPIAMAHDVAETTMIPRLPRGRQAVPVQLAHKSEAA